MAGDARVTEKLLAGYQAGDNTFKVHLDGYNLLPIRLHSQCPVCHGQKDHLEEDVKGCLAAFSIQNLGAVEVSYLV